LEEISSLASSQSSAMMSLQRLTHSSQIYTVGPAISLRTSSLLLPQNEHRRCRSIFSCLAMPPPVLLVFGSVFSALCSGNGLEVLGRARNDLVDQAVPFRFIARHEIVSFGISGNLFKRLPRMFGHDLVQPFANLENFSRMNINLRCLTLKAAHGLM